MTRKQKVTIIALIISVLGLSIGFAAFSNVLTIRSTAEISPDASNFRLVFANNTSVNNLDYSAVQPVNSNPLGGSGTINNQDNPTLTGLTAAFTAPGQSVSYKLYVVNTGKFLAYLTNLDFKNAQGAQNFKSCTGNGVSSNLLSAACADISVTVTIGGTDGVGGTTFSSNSQTLSNEINNISVQAGGAQEVYVTLSYADNDHLVDAPMTVTFGNIMLQYRSINEPTEIADLNEVEECEYTAQNAVNPFTSSCTYTDNDSSGSISTGDKVMCGTQGFYVIKTPSNGVVTMLSEWNLNVSDPNAETFKGISESQTYCANTIGYQDSHVRGQVDESDPNNLAYFKQITIYGSGSGSGSGSYASGSWSGSGSGTRTYNMPYGAMVFSHIANNDFYGYWTTGYDNHLNTSVYIDNNNGDYPAYVYDNNASISTYVNSYVSALNTSVSGANATGRLISYEELLALGCGDNNWICTSAPSWVYQTTYWSGSADGAHSIFEIESFGYYGASNYGYYSGVRPVIEISSSVISLAS